MSQSARTHKPFTRLWIFFLGLTIPSVLLLLFLHNSVVMRVRENSMNIIRGNQQMIVNSLEHTLTSSREDLSKALSTMDYVVFSNSSTAERSTRYGTKLAGKIRTLLSSYSEVVGFALYNSASDRFYDSTLHPFDDGVYSMLRYGASLPTGITLENCCSVEYRSKPYIIYTIQRRHATIILVIDPSLDQTYLAYNASADNTSKLFFLSSSSPENLEKQAVYTEFSSLPLTITLVDMSATAGWSQEPTQILILILILFIIGAILFIGRAMNRQLITPLRLLWESFRKISDDTGYRIRERSTLSEINDFYDGFNDMLDTIQQEKRKKEQSQLDAAHARLQYFQLQIRPHFYLNCLKNINAMASIHEDEKIQQVVYLMSDYIRYIFQDSRGMIPLQEELEAAQGYVDLCSAMGRSLELTFDLDSDGLQSDCLPMIVLTFIENSIKHSKDVPHLTMHIRTRMEQVKESDKTGKNPGTSSLGTVDAAEKDGEGILYHNITITDNGLGFSEEALNALNKADPSDLQYRRNHIGISNVRYRLWLLYGSLASVEFSNDEGNAVVHIRYPEHVDSNVLFDPIDHPI
ncbi:MAG: histidine kinase [Lachnospiraceae bacterium]|nr:histidine kinase [Lachnospiraceae bacterium]